MKLKYSSRPLEAYILRTKVIIKIQDIGLLRSWYVNSCIYECHSNISLPLLLSAFQSEYCTGGHALPHLWEICSKDPSGCLKLRIVPHPTYATFFLIQSLIFLILFLLISWGVRKRET